MLPDDTKIVVLDDDPTGTQTMHDVPVYTLWDRQTVLEAMKEPGNLFYILTNSRSFSQKETVRVHTEIAAHLKEAAALSGKRLLVVSRGDSTLRGHFPLETQTLYDALGGGFHGELIVPFFPEGGRLTRNDIHYVRQDQELIPTGETEFAKDPTFGYRSSHLGDWVEEKTGGRFTRESCIYLRPEDNARQLYQKLSEAENFVKIIVNASTYEELRRVVDALEKALAQGKRYLYRTAASFPKVLGRIPEAPLLTGAQLTQGGDTRGGLIVVGSYTQRTTGQLEYLLSRMPGGVPIPFHSQRVLEKDGLAAESVRVAEEIDRNIAQGKLSIVYTQRQPIAVAQADGEALLACSVAISQALTQAVRMLRQRPRYLIAKGGITSSDIATQALGIRRAWVLGQLQPGIPVWEAGPQSKYPGLPYIIFPGNVGEESTLWKMVRELEQG